MMAYVVYIGVFVLLLGAVGVVAWGTRPSGANRARLALQRIEGRDARTLRQLELSRPASQRLLKPALMRLAAFSRFITPQGRIRNLEIKVERAGRPWGLDANGLLAVKFLSLTIGLLVLIVLASTKLLPLIWFVVLAAIVVALTYYLPDIMVRVAIKQRQQLIARALPDFLDLLTVTVEAGLGLDSALAKISEKLRDPLREEILITLHHIRMGESRETALRRLAERCDVEELTNFVSALNQSQRLGIGLGQVLRVQADTIRTVRRQSIEERSQKAQVKMLLPLVFCIFPTLFVVILGPAAIRIYHALFG
ncbi:MAG: type II secretion system F family protein [Thermoleophilia bacterium]|nr:type II secretion system F family protein [Thermoleophilia bacterium]